MSCGHPSAPEGDLSDRRYPAKQVEGTRVRYLYFIIPLMANDQNPDSLKINEQDNTTPEQFNEAVSAAGRQA